MGSWELDRRRRAGTSRSSKALVLLMRGGETISLLVRVSDGTIVSERSERQSQTD